MRYQYARLYNIAPHDRSLDYLSNYEMQMYVDAWIEFNGIVSGKTKPGPSSDFLEMAELVKQKYANQNVGVPVTPEELGWDK